MEKINPKDLSACPHCGGVNGYSILRIARRVYRGSWGVIYNKLVQVEEEVGDVARCRDCGKPFEIRSDDGK